MHRSLLIFVLCTVTILGLAVYQVWTLLELLVVDGRADLIPQLDLPQLGSERSGNQHDMLIPKIIHQTYKDMNIPAAWQQARNSCIALHPTPGWQYKLWTDKTALEFIADKYPQHLKMFTDYRLPIQRADAIRYFVLDHYGGIYIDMDDGCNRPLDPLLKYPAFARKTKPTGISNDVMGAVPHHPFMERVIAELPRYDRSWILPYITVMSSTGPLFLSVIWRRYTNDGFNQGDGPSGGRIRILFPEEYKGTQWSFFTQHSGNSWHSYDVELIFWMSRHWGIVTVFGFVLGFSVLLISWWTYRTCTRPVLNAPPNKTLSPGPWSRPGSKSGFILPTHID